MMRKMELTLSFLLICCLAWSVSASQIVDAKIETKLVPGPVEYAVLLPDGYEAAKDPLPLLLFLHGGGGDKSFLARMRSIFDEMWKAGTLPPMVVVTPSAGRSFYMDYKDGSQKWETFIVTEFLDHLRTKYKVTRERKGTLLFGISMGGMGALRMGFKFHTPIVSASQTPDLPERIARIIGEYDRQGIHRTGSDVDTKSARWLAGAVKRCGLNPSFESFVINRVDSTSCYLLVGGKRIEGLPIFDGAFTDAAGMRGRIGQLGSEAEIGLVEAPPNAEYGPTYLKTRRETRHRAIVIAWAQRALSSPGGPLA